MWSYTVQYSVNKCIEMCRKQFTENNGCFYTSAHSTMRDLHHLRPHLCPWRVTSHRIVKSTSNMKVPQVNQGKFIKQIWVIWYKENNLQKTMAIFLTSTTLPWEMLTSNANNNHGKQALALRISRPDGARSEKCHKTLNCKSYTVVSSPSQDYSVYWL